MDLPNKSIAHVSLRKIVEYLLSETHPLGKSKAKYFRSYGFDEGNAAELASGFVDRKKLTSGKFGKVFVWNEVRFGWRIEYTKR